LLEAVRAESPDATVVVVTTDKCYENREWAYSYRETDALGGRDPYSASKAAAEIATAAWRASFFDGAEVSGRIATARAGNVIGGGDYADDRIVPDLVRALAAGQALGVRSPGSTRPWQHVLDCLSGYLALARWLATDPSASGHCERAFNFGPTQESERTVGDLVEECLRHWPGRWEDLSEPGAPHEATRLAVSIERSRAVLGWRPNWDFPTAVAETIEWYRARTEGASPSELRGIMNRQIAAFEA
jgi:CDP-glucose 4,6-dehydratase